MSPAQTRERESKWGWPTALATFLAVVLILISIPVNSVSGTGTAEVLRSTDAHSGSVATVALLQGLAFFLLALPLLYLFNAVRARSPRVRSQLLGLVIAAPLFLAVSTGLSGVRGGEAADQFVAGEAKSTLSPKEAKEECKSDLKDEGAKDFAEEFEANEGENARAACERQKTEDDEASNAISEASLTPLVTGLGIAGALGLLVVLFYCCLWGMRTGLLTRFWGSLGMAIGIVILLGLFPLALIWFAYFGLLIVGKVPGGKPPAWEAGEAIPWPTPGERAAAELEPSEDAEEAPADGSESADGERRKRKQRE
jgi:uncharacterized membrane protein